MAMDEKSKSDCLGGYSFLCMALGIFMLLPGSILTGLYASESGTMQIVALVIFSVALVLLIIGCVLCIIWCRTKPSDDEEKLAGEEDDKKDKDESKKEKQPASNGNAPRYARSPSPEGTSPEVAAEPGGTAGMDSGPPAARPYGRLSPLNPRPKSGEAGATSA